MSNQPNQPPLTSMNSLTSGDIARGAAAIKLDPYGDSHIAELVHLARVMAQVFPFNHHTFDWDSLHRQAADVLERIEQEL